MDKRRGPRQNKPWAKSRSSNENVIRHRGIEAVAKDACQIKYQRSTWTNQKKKEKAS